MVNYDAAEYDEISHRLDQLIEDSKEEISNWNASGLENTERVESDLDAWDFCFSIAIGLVAPYISTDEELQDYLKEIHNRRSWPARVV